MRRKAARRGGAPDVARLSLQAARRGQKPSKTTRRHRPAAPAAKKVQPAEPPRQRPRAISIANRHPKLALDRRAVERLVHLLDEHHATVAGPRSREFPGELSLVFLTDDALARLHGQFLDDPTTTDVITFEGDPAHGVGGEICVSVDTAAAYARGHGRDFREELALYVVHGWLHLAGHDDLVPAKKRLMRRAEARAMKVLERAQAVPDFRLRAR